MGRIHRILFAGRNLLASGFGHGRKENREATPLPHPALCIDMAPVFGDHLVCDRQTQTRSGILGGEEGIEYRPQVFVGDPMAGVFE